MLARVHIPSLGGATSGSTQATRPRRAARPRRAGELRVRVRVARWTTGVPVEVVGSEAEAELLCSVLRGVGLLLGRLAAARTIRPGMRETALSHRGRSESAGPTDPAIELDDKQQQLKLPVSAGRDGRPPNADPSNGRAPAVRHSPAGWRRSGAPSAETSSRSRRSPPSEHPHPVEAHGAVPVTPRRTGSTGSATATAERRPPSRPHPRTDVPHVRPAVHDGPQGSELLPAGVPGAQVPHAARERIPLGPPAARHL